MKRWKEVKRDLKVVGLEQQNMYSLSRVVEREAVTPSVSLSFL